jgi:hypothetical protein
MKNTIEKPRATAITVMDPPSLQRRTGRAVDGWGKMTTTRICMGTKTAESRAAGR